MATLKKARLLAAITVAGLAIAGSPAFAQEVYHPFVKDQFYLARGGTPATFEQVAGDPLSVFRSQAAYDAFRAHVSGYLGRNLDDAQFRALLRSDGIRLVPCVGRIDTAGVTNSGRFGWRERACYRNEMNIEIRLDDGRWVMVGSQACWNAVRGEVPPLPPPPPPPPPPVVEVRKPSCRLVPLSSITTPAMYNLIPGHVLASCCPQCQPGVFVPGLLFQQGGTTSTTYIQVCE